jgi:uncharacterized membrane protein YqjE
MFHPLFKTLATQPELLAEHAGAYAELAAVEAAGLGLRLRRQALLWCLLAASAALAAGLAGVAVLLAAAIPAAAMPAPALLWCVPALPAVVAAGCAWALRQTPAGAALASLKQQWSADRALWRAAAQEQAR